MKYKVPTILFLCLVTGISYAMKGVRKTPAKEQAKVITYGQFFCGYCGKFFGDFQNKRAHEAHCTKDPSKPRK